jgi:hypothetical protein
MDFYKACLILIFACLALSSAGQNCYDRTKPCHPGDTLVNKFLKLKFVTDNSQKSLIALDQNNKTLWQTNPWANESFNSFDSSMNSSFRLNHITAFFLSGKKGKSNSYIYLEFLNSPITAVVEQKNGMLHLIGVK